MLTPARYVAINTDKQVYRRHTRKRSQKAPSTSKKQPINSDMEMVKTPNLPFTRSELSGAAQR